MTNKCIHISDEERREAMGELIAQDADLLEKTSQLSNERDAGQPWLRTYDAHLKAFTRPDNV